MPEEYQQGTRPMTVSTPLGTDKLLLTGFDGVEQVSGLYSFRLEMIAKNDIATTIKFDQVLGKELAVTLLMDGDAKRYFRGICRRFEQGDRDQEFTAFRAEIVPQFWLTTRTARSRIFQQLNVPDILKKVLAGLNVEYKIEGTFQPRDYCVQYRETDFNFVSRLMEEEGIYYFFKHTDAEHKLIIANTGASHPDVPGDSKVRWNVEHGQEVEGNHIFEWLKRQEVRSGKFSLWDHSFERPGDNLASTKNTLATIAVGTVTHKLQTAGNDQFEIYDYPGEYAQRFDGVDPGGGDRAADVGKITSDGNRTVELRMQAETLAGLLIEGNSNCSQFTSGHKFTLKDHFDANGKYILTSVHHSARGGNAYRSGDDSEFVYSNNFACIPDALPFRPQRTTPKPCVMGAQTAVVVGPAGEEIFTDKYGRVKVQFPWDRESKADANSSCWLRVGTAWAGKQWGMIHIPRIGQEVIVQFMEGDPDSPIVIGSVFNASEMPPYKLPDHKTMSTLKSLSTKGGGGFNEIRLEDKKGSEQLFMHAEKDEDIRVKHDAKEWIGNDRHLVVKDGSQYEWVKKKDKHSIVKGDRLSKTEGDVGETIKGDRAVAISKNDNLSVTSNRNVKITGDENLKVAGVMKLEVTGKVSIKAGKDIHGKTDANYAIDAAQEVHIKAGTKIILEAGSQISLKVGGNFIDIGPAGISIKGTMVNINSGGAAGSGSGSSPDAPAAPQDPDAAKEAKDADKADPGQKDPPPKAQRPPKPVTYSPPALVLQQASKSGAPFCEKCEAAKAARCERMSAAPTTTRPPEEIAKALSSHLFSEDAEMHTYAILDGAAVPDLLDQLYGDESPDFHCLYRGELEPDLAEVAPYLVQLKPESPFTRWLLENCWGHHWGIFVISAEDIDVLRRHFRNFLLVKNPEGKQIYFRYYDPRVFRTYLPTCNSEETGIIFGPVKSYLCESDKPDAPTLFGIKDGLPQQETIKLVD